MEPRGACVLIGLSSGGANSPMDDGVLGRRARRWKSTSQPGHAGSARGTGCGARGSLGAGLGEDPRNGAGRDRHRLRPGKSGAGGFDDLPKGGPCIVGPVALRGAL